MLFAFKKFLINFTFNFTIFLMLIIGIQNSTRRTKVDVIFGETVKIPISFVIGVSFISGSLMGTFLTLNSKEKKN